MKRYNESHRSSLSIWCHRITDSLRNALSQGCQRLQQLMGNAAQPHLTFQMEQQGEDGFHELGVKGG